MAPCVKCYLLTLDCEQFCWNEVTGMIAAWSGGWGLGVSGISAMWRV